MLPTLTSSDVVISETWSVYRGLLQRGDVVGFCGNDAEGRRCLLKRIVAMVCMYVCIYVYVYMYVCVYMYIYY